MALGPANRVAVVDAKTFEVVNYVLVGQRPWHLDSARWLEALRRQWPHQRHDHHRYGEPEGDQVGAVGRLPGASP